MKITSCFALKCLNFIAEGIYCYIPRLEFHSLVNSPILDMLYINKEYSLYELKKSIGVVKKLTNRMNLIFLSNFISDDKNILEVVDNDDKINIIIFKDNIKQIINDSTGDEILDAINIRDLFMKIFNMIFYLCDSNYSKISPQKTIYEVSIASYPGLFALKLAMSSISPKFMPREILIYNSYTNSYDSIAISDEFLALINDYDFKYLIENNTLTTEIIKKFK